MKHRGLYNTKAILIEQRWYFLTNRWANKVVHTFPRSPKVNVIAKLSFELAIYDFVVKHISHCATETYFLSVNFHKVLSAGLYSNSHHLFKKTL